MALMVAGKIAAVGKPNEVLLPEMIEAAYCLPVQVVKHPFLPGLIVLPDLRNYDERLKGVS
jgi:ABC-type hemin transport system ATPase subunit